MKILFIEKCSVNTFLSLVLTCPAQVFGTGVELWQKRLNIDQRSKDPIAWLYYAL